MADSNAAVTAEFPILIRLARAPEYRLVQARWNRRMLRLPTCDAYRDGPGAHIAVGRGVMDLRMDLGAMASMHRRYIDDVLAHPNTGVLVAVLPDLDEPLGWICWTGLRCHYVDVLAAARRNGVGRRLVQHVRSAAGGPMSATFVTRDGAALLEYLR